MAVESSCNISLVYTNGTVTPPVQATATVNYKYTGINQHEYSNSSQVTLSYETTQAMAALSVTPVSQSFGNVLNNNSATSPQQIFTVVNGGPNPASAVSSSFTESNAALFHIISTTCGSSIPANSSCTVTAKFGPFASSTAAGTKTAALTMQYKPYTGSTNTLTAKSAVTGQAVSAQSAVIGLSSAVATGFESGNGTQSTPYLVTSGNAAPALTYTLTNSGSVPATSFYLNATKLNGKWILTSNSCGTSNSKVTLSANGGSCNFTVRVSSTSTVQANNFVPSQIQASWIDEDSPAPDGQSQDLSGNTVYASITPPPVSITVTTPNISESVLMGNYYQFTVTIPAGGNVSPQTITATTTASATTVAAESGTCTLQTTTSPHVTSCTFRVRTSWELTTAGNYSVSLQSSGTATFVPSNTFSYTVTAPAAPVLRTGQTPTLPENPAPNYSDGYYQAGVIPPSTRFVTGSGAEADCITDKLTGLMYLKNWTQIPLNQYQSTQPGWQQSLDYAANTAAFCGHNDWRIVNINELGSLINSSVVNQSEWLNSQGFSNTFSGYFWTSTIKTMSDLSDPNTLQIYAYNLYYGGFINDFFINSGGLYNYLVIVRNDDTSYPNAPGKLPKSGQTNTQPIDPAATYSDGYYQKGVAWPSSRFVSGTGAQESCVIDKLTGLMWIKDITQLTLSKNWDWNEALSSVHQITYCGYSDWRIPNINEIRSLINYGQMAKDYGYATWLMTQGFTNIPVDYNYWTSTVYTNSPDDEVDYWDWDMGKYNDGYKVLDPDDEDDPLYIMPVRNGIAPQV